MKNNLQWIFFFSPIARNLPEGYDRLRQKFRFVRSVFLVHTVWWRRRCIYSLFLWFFFLLSMRTYVTVPYNGVDMIRCRDIRSISFWWKYEDRGGLYDLQWKKFFSAFWCSHFSEGNNWKFYHCLIKKG